MTAILSHLLAGFTGAFLGIAVLIAVAEIHHSRKGRS